MNLLFFLGWFPIFALGFFWARKVLQEKNLWNLILSSLPLSISILVVFVGILGKMTHNFHSAFLWSSLLALLLSLLLGINIFLKEKEWSFRFKFEKGDLFTIITGALTTFLVTRIAFRFAFHDEVGFQSHVSITEQMQRGIFPPTFLSFPDIPNRYHYGSDLIAAAFSETFRLPGYIGVDFITVFSWIALWFLLWDLFRRWEVPRKLLGWGLIFVLLTGGLSWLLASGFTGPKQIPHWQHMFLYGRFIHQNFSNYFFQHPMGVGMFFLVGVLRYFEEGLSKNQFKTLLTAAFLLGALSLVQVTLFVTCLAALALVFLFRFFIKESSKKKNLLLGLSVAVISLGITFLLGGFFQFDSSLYENFPIKFAWPPGYLIHEFWRSRHEPLNTFRVVRWYLSSFGWILFLFPFLIWKAFRQKNQTIWLVAFFCLLSVFTAEFLYYPYSSNIRKWLLTSELSIKILAVVLLGKWVVERSWRKALAASLMVLVLVAPMRFWGSLALKDLKTFRGPERVYGARRHRPPNRAWQSLFQKMKECSDCYGLVWSTWRTAFPITLHTGYSILALDGSTIAMPIRREKIRERRILMNKLNKKPTNEILAKSGARWVIFSCNEFNKLPDPTKNLIFSLKEDPQFEDYSQSEKNGCIMAFFKKNKI